MEAGGDLRLPSKAPEAAELVFRLGCLSARQAAALWPYGQRPVRYAFPLMTEAGLLRRDRCSLRYAPGNGHLLVPGGSHAEGARRPARWEEIFSLTPEGVRYVADALEITLPAARSRYKRSYADGRREHAYLRNEGYFLIAQAVSGLRGVELAGAEAEGGVGRKQLPRAEGQRHRYVEPDGLLEVVYQETGGAREKTTVYVESDTGTQDSMNVIAEKIEGYAEWYLNGGDGPSDKPLAEPPPVLFISPTRRRSEALATYIRRAAEEREKSYFRALHNHRLNDDWPDGALDVVCTTSLELLRESGPSWASSFEYLCDDVPGPLV